MPEVIIEYIAFVPDGKPTLEINLGHEIGILKTPGLEKLEIILTASLKKTNFFML